MKEALKAAMKTLNGMVVGFLWVGLGCGPTPDAGRNLDRQDASTTVSVSASQPDAAATSDVAKPGALRTWDGRRFVARLDPFDLERVSVSGDELLLQLSTGGGCEKHEYAVWWSGDFKEDGDGGVMVDLRISHNAKNDPCEAIVTHELRVDISPIRNAFGKAHPESGRTLRMRFPDGGNQREHKWKL